MTPTNAVQLVEKLRVEKPHEQWANFAADHLTLALEALEKTKTFGHKAHSGAEDRSVPYDQCPLYPCCETRHALATVAEAAQKALKA